MDDEQRNAAEDEDGLRSGFVQRAEVVLITEETRRTETQQDEDVEDKNGEHEPHQDAGAPMVEGHSQEEGHDSVEEKATADADQCNTGEY